MSTQQVGLITVDEDASCIRFSMPDIGRRTRLIAAATFAGLVLIVQIPNLYSRPDARYLFGVVFIALTVVVGIAARTGSSLLTVDTQILRPSGRKASLFSVQRSVVRAAVLDLRYVAPSRYTPKGLYVETSDGVFCMLPGVGEDDANDLADIIYKYFPDTRRGESRHGPMSLHLS